MRTYIQKIPIITPIPFIKGFWLSFHVIIFRYHATCTLSWPFQDLQSKVTTGGVQFWDQKIAKMFSKVPESRARSKIRDRKSSFTFVVWKDILIRFYWPWSDCQVPHRAGRTDGRTNTYPPQTHTTWSRHLNHNTWQIQETQLKQNFFSFYFTYAAFSVSNFCSSGPRHT